MALGEIMLMTRQHPARGILSLGVISEFDPDVPPGFKPDNRYQQ